MKRLLALLFVGLPLLACDDETTTEPTPEPTMYPAEGVTITEVAIYQSLKRSLAVNGEQAPQSAIPLVEGRDAMIRVFFETNGDYDGEEVTGELILDDGEPIVVTGKLFGPSDDGSLASTVNFFVPGERIGPSFKYSVALLQKAASENSAARYPASGTATVTMDAPKQTFRVVLAPLRYDWDGSGRLPDLSDEAVAVYKARLKAIFPVSDVEIFLRNPQPWDKRIGPDGTGWNDIIMDTIGFRAVDGSPNDYYYYAIFNPEPTFFDYCGGGCLLGLTLLNDMPSDRGQPLLRIAAGIGYEGYGPDTTAHELGHAHGRAHANCGPGLDPQSIDDDFPHPGGRIGTWGLDPITGATFDPEIARDFMGYCDFSWVSDYNYAALLARGSLVNLPRWETAPKNRAAVLSLDADGGLRFGHTVEVPQNLAGARHPARVREHGGAPREVEATVLSFDHLPGGLVIVPNVSEGVSEVELTLPDRTVSARR